MNITWVVAVAVALGADAFSLSLAIGLRGIQKRMIVHLSLVIAAFHVFMPLCGMILGQALGTILGQYANYMGAVVLIGLGGRMIYNVYRPDAQQYSFGEARKGLFQKKSPSNSSLKGWGIYILAASVSIDALSVGVSLGTIRADLFITVMIMGLVAGLMTAMGLVLGGMMGTRLGNKAELLGGVVLFLIGVKLFF